MLELKLNEMGLDVLELKQTQPHFFEMVLLCYQANMSKLQQAGGLDEASESRIQQIADECLLATIDQIN